jgi:glycosyltransferase involved in cell wall biosynthesis
MTEPNAILSDVAVVAIGRNEGERLRACLQSIVGQASAVVYVDSGSSDGSVALARQMGAQVVELDRNIPFTAARARNEGFARAGDVRFVQFVDGDCRVVPGWLESARAALESNEKLAAVCGRRRERFPEKSVYNELMDLEWETPVGPARAVGGDAMFRVVALKAVNGFDPTVMAGEEPELCLRLRHAGWSLARLDIEMTLHDAALLSFGQWWRRQVRGGFGMLDVTSRFCVGGERLFVKPVRSARLWALGWPIAIVVAAIAGGPKWGTIFAGLILLALPVQIARIAHVTFHRRRRSFSAAIAHGVLTMLGKWANVQGQLRYLRDRAAGQRGRLIEYKQPAGEAPG